MNYEDAIKKIKSLEKMGPRPNLKRISKLLDMMGNPHKGLKYIHVAGTNGKGSVCFMLASILKESGYNTGLYTSPSIEDFRERIQINGNMIEKKELCDCLKDIEKHLNSPCFLNDPITEFELTTAMAFKYFKEKSCDIVILETGMGGRLDATNVIDKPLCSVVTSISFDHVEFLGSTLLEIAKEKFGIIKQNSKVVIGSNQSKEIYQLLKNMCNELNSEFYIADLESIKRFKNANLKASTFEYLGTKIKLPLFGKHQLLNVSLVISVLELLKDKLNISIFEIKQGLEKVKLPCRIEIFSTSPLIIMDASHNVEGIVALNNFLKNDLKTRRLVAIFCMLKEKDAEGIFKIIGKRFAEVIVVKSDSYRALEPQEAAKIIFKYNKNVCCSDIFSEKVQSLISSLTDEEGLVIFGTFSIMKMAKKLISSYINS